jgi:hypothetical protein
MGPVISILTDVNDSHGRTGFGDGLNLSGDTPGQMHAAGANADEHQLVGVRSFLDDFMGHPGQGSAQFRLLQQDLLLLAHDQKKDPLENPRGSCR